MSKKHFQKLANTLGRSMVSQRDLDEIMDTLEDINPLFCRVKFNEAVTKSSQDHNWTQQ